MHNPITGRAIDFSKVPAYQFRKALHHELVCLRKVALRLGELSDRRQWLLRDETTKRLLKGQINVQDLTEDDVTYDVTQKGVDIKFGIDIASLAYKRLVEKVVLITGVWPRPGHRAPDASLPARTPHIQAAKMFDCT